MAYLLITVSLGVLAALAGQSEGRNLRTINKDIQFQKWPAGPIPYCLDAAYTLQEKNMIYAAISNVQSGTNFVVAFQEVACSATTFKIHVQPYYAGQTTEAAYCSSWTGQKVSLLSTPEQVMTISRSSTGCLNVTKAGMTGALRGIVKMFCLVLGKKNEYQRGDRDSYITVNTANLVAPAASAYNKFDSTQANWTTYAYDFCSITHAQPLDFSNGNPVFTIVAGTLPGYIPMDDKLSLYDCQWLNRYYGGDPSKCTQRLCAATTMATTMGTTAMSMSTTTMITTTGATTVCM